MAGLLDQTRLTLTDEAFSELRAPLRPFTHVGEDPGETFKWRVWHTRDLQRRKEGRRACM